MTTDPTVLANMANPDPASAQERLRDPSPRVQTLRSATPTRPDLIVLADADNVGTALADLPAGADARVTGIHGPLPPLPLLQEIRLGHKAALRPIAARDLVVKHGQPIGRATAAIAAGDHVHVHNVVSLSRETDLAPTTNETTGDLDA